jgi:sulfotransferase
MLERDRSDRPMPDKRADYFMNGNRMIEKIVNLKAFMNSVPENIMLVDYDDLVAEPYRVIGSIYDFLRIPYYDHFFDGLTTPHNYTDRWGVKNQHTVKSSIKKEQYDIEKLFSQETISRYSNLEFWKQQS